MPFPATLVDTACIVMSLGTDAKPIVGRYDEQGYCIVKLGPYFARPPMQIVGESPREGIEPSKDQLDLGAWK